MTAEVSEKEKKRQAKIKTVLHDIKVGKIKKVTAGLSALKTIGDDDVILPLLELLNKGVQPEVEAAIVLFIEDIKSSTSAKSVMTIITNNAFKKIRLPLLTTIWNSKVDYSDYLFDFVKIAIDHDLLYAFECLTIIENLTGPFEENQILEAQMALRAYAEKQQENQQEDEAKVEIMVTISEYIDDIDRNLSA